jgi:hypothetical protein
MKTFLAQPDHFRMSTAGFDLVDWDAVDLVMGGGGDSPRCFGFGHLNI